ncbi:MAG: hypothetical protein R6W77_07855 [Trueperaceae bacterium]
MTLGLGARRHGWGAAFAGHACLGRRLPVAPPLRGAAYAWRRPLGALLPRQVS